MTAFSDFFRGFMVMIILGLIGLFFIFCNGLIIDYIMDAFLVSGINAGSGTAWDTNSNVNLLINVLYYVGIGIMVVGIIVFIVTIVNKTRYDYSEIDQYEAYDYEF